MSREVQEAIVGRAMDSAESYDRVALKLGVQDFTDDCCRLVWELVSKLREAGREPDAVTVAAMLGRSTRWAALEGGDPLAYAQYLQLGTPSGRLLDQYVALVQGEAVNRRIRGYAETVSRIAANDGMDAGAKLAAVQAAMPTEEPDEGATITYGKAGRLAIEDMRRRANDEIKGVESGLADLDALIGGFEPGTLTLVAGRPSHGKAQPLDARIRTTAGWATMGELAVGDRLASIDGRPSEVVAIHPRGHRETYRLTFGDGRSTRACADHLWTVMYRDWSEPRTVDTAKLIDMLGKSRYRGRLWIDPVSVESESSADLALDPYALGALIGDGGFRHNRIGFTNSDAHVAARLQERLPEGDELFEHQPGQYRIRRGRSCDPAPRTRDIIRSLGLLEKLSVEKSIPRAYLDAPRVARVELIRGLMDTDGTVEKSGAPVFATSSEQLSKDFAELVRSVGGQCRITSRIPGYRGPSGERLEGARAYRCAVFHPDPASLFTLPRKAERLAVRTGARQWRLTVDSIVPDGIEETQCITVSHPSHLYVTDDYVVTHNSIIAMQLAEAAAAHGPVFVFSIEMTAMNLAQRAISARASTDFGDMRAARIDERMDMRMSEAVVAMDDMAIVIDERTGYSVDQLRARVRMMARRAPPAMIVLDYLTLVTGVGDNRTAQVGYVSRSLKAMAKEIGVPVVTVAQLNRGVDSRTDKRPTSSDLRDSGEVEQDADVIVCTYLHEKYDPETPRAGFGELIVAKNRNGRTGNVFVGWEGRYQRFVNHVGEVPPEKSGDGDGGGYEPRAKALSREFS